MITHSVDVLGPLGNSYDEILTDAALAFVADLTRTFRGPILERLKARKVRPIRGAQEGQLIEVPAHKRVGFSAGADDRRTRRRPRSVRRVFRPPRYSVVGCDTSIRSRASSSTGRDPRKDNAGRAANPVSHNIRQSLAALPR